MELFYTTHTTSKTTPQFCFCQNVGIKSESLKSCSGSSFNGVCVPVCFPVQEMEQMQRYNQRLIEEMKNKQTQERTRLPKIQRSEAKTRMAMFKKSLRITGAAITPEQEREKVKQVSSTFHRLLSCIQQKE